VGLEAIKYDRGSLEVLDQLRLPHESHFDKVSTCAEAYDCIKSMRVRGAPAIAIVAALALAVELEHKRDSECISAWHDATSILSLIMISSRI
jgi:methylthioribose-1-phosphate isomerase